MSTWILSWTTATFLTTSPCLQYPPLALIYVRGLHLKAHCSLTMCELIISFLSLVPLFFRWHCVAFMWLRCLSSLHELLVHSSSFVHYYVPFGAVSGLLRCSWSCFNASRTLKWYTREHHPTISSLFSSAVLLSLTSYYLVCHILLHWARFHLVCSFLVFSFIFRLMTYRLWTFRFVTRLVSSHCICISSSFPLPFYELPIGAHCVLARDSSASRRGCHFKSFLGDWIG